MRQIDTKHKESVELKELVDQWSDEYQRQFKSKPFWFGRTYRFRFATNSVIKLIKLCDEKPDLVNSAIEELSDPDAKYYAKDAARWVAWHLHKENLEPANTTDDAKNIAFDLIKGIWYLISVAVIFLLIVWFVRDFS